MERLADELLEIIEAPCPAANLSEAQKAILGVLARYEIKPVKVDVDHRIADKVRMFLAAKKLEGASPYTIKNYSLELAVFGKYVSKDVDQITTADIRQVTGKEILDALGMQPGEIDCVVEGPPCQGFGTFDAIRYSLMVSSGAGGVMRGTKGVRDYKQRDEPKVKEEPDQVQLFG